MKLQITQENLNKISDYADHSISYIYSCHVLQKFTKEELLDIFKELKRILSDGEIIRISVPDYYLLSDKYIKSKCRIEEINKILKDSKIFLDFVLLHKLLIQSGFYAVKRYDSQKLGAEDESTLVINGEIISLNIEAYG